MFRKCGSKCKVLAIVAFWLELIAGIIIAIVYPYDGKPFIIIPCAFLVAWLSNIGLYTIGDIWQKVNEVQSSIKNISKYTETIERNLRINSEKASAEIKSAPPVSSKIVGSTWRCSECGKENPLSKTVCQCGKYK